MTGILWVGGILFTLIGLYKFLVFLFAIGIFILDKDWEDKDS